MLSVIWNFLVSSLIRQCKKLNVKKRCGHHRRDEVMKLTLSERYHVSITIFTSAMLSKLLASDTKISPLDKMKFHAILFVSGMILISLQSCYSFQIPLTMRPSFPVRSTTAAARSRQKEDKRHSSTSKRFSNDIFTATSKSTPHAVSYQRKSTELYSHYTSSLVPFVWVLTSVLGGAKVFLSYRNSDSFCALYFNTSSCIVFFYKTDLFNSFISHSTFLQFSSDQDMRDLSLWSKVSFNICLSPCIDIVQFQILIENLNALYSL